MNFRGETHQENLFVVNELEKSASSIDSATQRAPFIDRGDIRSHSISQLFAKDTLETYVAAKSGGVPSTVLRIVSLAALVWPSWLALYGGSYTVKKSQAPRNVSRSVGGAGVRVRVNWGEVR